MSSRRRQAVAATVAAAAVLSVACSPFSGDDGSAGEVESSPASPNPTWPKSALDDRFDPRLPEPLVDPDELRIGVPADAIPAIHQPAFETADEVTWLEPGEPVLSLTVGGKTRAYPLRVMAWHEIVNDTVGGVPVAVTYCPLCNSGVAFLREVDGRTLSFGVSGLLYADNLVMYDRETESLWPQLTGEASVGVLTGAVLDAVPMGTVAWEDFREAHPKAEVLSQRTGFERPYGSNPYSGYDDPDGDLLFALPDDPDSRLPVKERVVGIEVDGSALAVVRSTLAGRDPAEVRVGGRTLTVWHQPGQRSALDTPRLASGAEIGSVAVFDPVVDGRRLSFVADGTAVRDTQTGSRWSILGRAVDGPLTGTQLRLHEHLDTFWFAWAAFHPDTELLDPEEAR